MGNQCSVLVNVQVHVINKLRCRCKENQLIYELQCSVLQCTLYWYYSTLGVHVHYIF